LRASEAKFDTLNDVKLIEKPSPSRRVYPPRFTACLLDPRIAFTSLQAKVTLGTVSMGFCEYLRAILIGLLAGQFMVSCAAAGPFNLAGSEWGFAEETGRSARFVQFRADGVVGGSSGCNRFTGTYNHKDDELTFGPLASTRMACPPEVMEGEQQFLTMLGYVRSAEASHLKLVLRDGNGEVLAELVRRDGD